MNLDCQGVSLLEVTPWELILELVDGDGCMDVVQSLMFSKWEDGRRFTFCPKAFREINTHF